MLPQHPSLCQEMHGQYFFNNPLARGKARAGPSLRCPLLAQSGHSVLRIVATENDGWTPILDRLRVRLSFACMDDHATANQTAGRRRGYIGCPFHKSS
jgi:hypothetical protein